MFQWWNFRDTGSLGSLHLQIIVLAHMSQWTFDSKVSLKQKEVAFGKQLLEDFKILIAKSDLTMIR